MADGNTIGRSLVNFAHLDHMSEEIVRGGEIYRLVHIYCEAPHYRCVADPAEGMSCVDDVARAALMYLRHFELTGDDSSRQKAEQMLRFILHMQAPEGLFFNFVTDRELRINRTHVRSRAIKPEWWTARAVWALATASRALSEADPVFSHHCFEATVRVLPHIARVLEKYPQTIEYRGRTVPTWLLYEDGADATSELLLGLVAMNQYRPNPELQQMIVRLAEGITMMRYGSMNSFPFGLHASNKHGWHKWGNSQTQALAEAGMVVGAKAEADQFYPRLLVEGWLHSISFDHLHGVRYYERIAYGVRSVAVGLIRLCQLTGDVKYARMAGLAASWFFGNNAANFPMYDPQTGRGYDGLISPTQVNYNAGAESTIEALHTILETEHVPEARRWLNVRADPPTRFSRGGDDYFYRLFRSTDGRPARVAVIMNLTQEQLEVLADEKLEQFLDGR
jgi:hypothetical protein